MSKAMTALVLIHKAIPAPTFWSWPRPLRTEGA